ncbi:MAG: THUMP domain-containing protein, partial [Candidatus Poseidoniaceae archaeon]
YGVSLVPGRIGSMEVVTSNSSANEVENLLSHVLGVVAIDPAKVISEDIDPEIVAKLILEKDEMRGQKRTFGVRTKRLAPKDVFKSQEYSAQVGHHMVVNDPSLSVNLREPDVWVRLVLEANRVWLLDERIQGAGGLPPGVQGDVLCKVTDEDSMLSSFLVMRRGSRLIPTKESETEFVKILKSWDPYLGRNSNVRDLNGKMRRRHPWGVVALSVEEGESLIERNESEVKTVPLSTLEPLCAWTDLEKENLSKHIRDPINFLCMPNLDTWVS